MFRCRLSHCSSLVFPVLEGCASGPDAIPTPLMPSGPHADSPAVVRYIVPNSSAQQYLDLGYTITAVDGQEVAGTYALYTLLSSQVSTFTVERPSGNIEEIPAS